MLPKHRILQTLREQMGYLLHAFWLEGGHSFCGFGPGYAGLPNQKQPNILISSQGAALKQTALPSKTPNAVGSSGPLWR